MDRRKAIEYVKQAFAVWQSEFCTPDGDWSEETEARDFVIEALREPTEIVRNCIDRDKAIDIVKTAKTKEVAYSQLINLDSKEIPICDECRCPRCLVEVEKLQLTEETSTISENESVEGGAESATTTHGRLLDADALAEDIRQKCLADNTPMNIAIGKALTVYLLEAPTIVPATPKTATTTDCISRKQAIEALTGWETEPLDEDIVRELNALPPVTPTVSEDCISREWLINHFKDIVEHYEMRIKRVERHGEKTTYDTSKQIGSWKDEIADYKYFIREIENAPSVVPKAKEGNYIKGENGEWYCSNCGSRMRGEHNDE